MAITIDKYHECSHKCFDNRIRYYEDRITQLSGRVYRLSGAIELSHPRVGPRESSSFDKNDRELRITMGDLEQIWKQLEGESEGIQEHFETVRQDTLRKLDGYSKELGWTLGRFNQLKGDVEWLAERGRNLRSEENFEPVHDFAEPASRSDSPRPFRRRRDSSETSDSEPEEEPVKFKPPTCRERAEQKAQELFKAGKKWIRTNRGFAASIALNVILLGMRKFS